MAEAAASRLRAAERAIGLEFNDPSLLQLALVHSSLLNELEECETPRFEESNERLEFLGDAVLGLLVAEYLYDRFPDVPEGRLTVHRATLVRTETLARWAIELQLGDLLLVGRGETRGADGISNRVLAGAFEAILGAIYLDRGLDAARDFLARFLDRDAAAALAERDLTNYKGQLQERIQRDDVTLPAYVVVSQQGPDHDRSFIIEVRHRGETIGRGSGRTKRSAEQAAARDALARLQAGIDCEPKTGLNEQQRANDGIGTH